MDIALCLCDVNFFEGPVRWWGVTFGYLISWLVLVSMFISLDITHLPFAFSFSFFWKYRNICFIDNHVQTMCNKPLVLTYLYNDAWHMVPIGTEWWCTEAKQPKLTAIIQSRQLTLFGHIMRMDERRCQEDPVSLPRPRQTGEDN